MVTAAVRANRQRRGIAAAQVARLIDAVWLPLQGTALGQVLYVPEAVLGVDLCRLVCKGLDLQDTQQVPLHTRDMCHLQMRPAVSDVWAGPRSSCCMHDMCWGVHPAWPTA